MCDVCLDYEFEDGDEILICSTCMVATHRTCYGSELRQGIPSEDWHCARCTELRNTQKTCQDIKCLFCPDIDGVIKPITCGKGKKEQMWAHLVCVNWIPEMWFKDDAKEVVDGCIPKDRFQIACGRCRTNKDKEGACITCDYKNCRKTFHVRCGIKQGAIECWDTMLDELDNPDDEDGIPIFCQDHL